MGSPVDNAVIFLQSNMAEIIERKLCQRSGGLQRGAETQRDSISIDTRMRTISYPAHQYCAHLQICTLNRLRCSTRKTRTPSTSSNCAAKWRSWCSHPPIIFFFAIFDSSSSIFQLYIFVDIQSYISQSSSQKNSKFTCEWLIEWLCRMSSRSCISPTRTWPTSPAAVTLARLPPSLSPSYTFLVRCRYEAKNIYVASSSVSLQF